MRDFYFVCSGTLTYDLTVQAETPEEAWLKVERDNFKDNLAWERNVDSAERCVDGICEEFECEHGGWYQWDAGRREIEVTCPSIKECLTFYEKGGCQCPDPFPVPALPPLREAQPLDRGDGTVVYRFVLREVSTRTADVVLPKTATAADVQQQLRDFTAWRETRVLHTYEACDPSTHEVIHTRHYVSAHPRS